MGLGSSYRRGDEGGKPVGVTLEHYSQISDSSTSLTLPPITPVL